MTLRPFQFISDQFFYRWPQAASDRSQPFRHYTQIGNVRAGLRLLPPDLRGLGRADGARGGRTLGGVSRPNPDFIRGQRFAKCR